MRIVIEVEQSLLDPQFPNGDGSLCCCSVVEADALGAANRFANRLVGLPLLEKEGDHRMKLKKKWRRWREKIKTKSEKERKAEAVSIARDRGWRKYAREKATPKED